jgi:hypothetical protein
MIIVVCEDAQDHFDGASRPIEVWVEEVAHGAWRSRASCIGNGSIERHLRGALRRLALTRAKALLGAVSALAALTAMSSTRACAPELETGRVGASARTT